MAKKRFLQRFWILSSGTNGLITTKQITKKDTKKDTLPVIIAGDSNV
jgi:hypothetical protein